MSLQDMEVEEQVDAKESKSTDSKNGQTRESDKPTKRIERTVP